VHLLAVTVVALPSPESAMNRAAWSDPTVQDELTTLTALANRGGITVTEPELEDDLWAAATRVNAVRDQVVGPVRPYAQLCGTEQHWVMFVAPHRYPTRLWLEVRDGDGWRPVYVEGDPQRRWLAGHLEDYRVRSVTFTLGWPGFEGDYDEVAHWAAARAAHVFPGEDFRVRLYKYRTPSPEEVRTGRQPAGEFIRERVFERGPVP
jgi:hypothetical protein